METDSLNHLLFDKESCYDNIYPSHIKDLSQTHWTPVDIARKAALFLGVPQTKVLDIGSGVGKFCITAGAHYPQTDFIGIEQRKELYNHAEAARTMVKLDNVSFIHGNITELDYNDFDHFYFFNSFYENIDPGSRIDNSIKTSVELYTHYSRFIFSMLDTRKSGTRLVTYFARETQIPTSYDLIENGYNKLKMWIRR